MNFQSILSRIGTQSRRSFHLYETFILSLLEHHLTRQNKPIYKRARLITLESKIFIADAIAPDGIDDIGGATLIDIRFTFVERNIHHSERLENWLLRLGLIAVENQLSTVLLIFPIELHEDTRRRLHEFAQPWPQGVQLEIWDANILSNLVDRYQDFISTIYSDLDTIRLQDAVKRKTIEWAPHRVQRRDTLEVKAPSEDWILQRNQYIEQLQQAYADSELTLFLGAGVSIDAGAPDWDSLLNALFVTLATKKLTNIEVRDEEIDEIVNRLRCVDAPSPLLAARYLRRGFSESTVNDEIFLNTVTEVLYRLVNPKKLGKSELLKQIARMCLPRRSGPKIRAVVTYNFDDMLEDALTEAAVMHRSIFRDADLADRDELPVYHVHGFLPKKRDDYDELDKSTLVFSEEGYHEIFLDSYHWSNIVQLNLLRESSCLMVGLSLTDPNLRRLLEIAARRNDSARHYALMRRLSIDEFMMEGGKQVVKSRKTPVKEFLDNHHRINEALFSELGLNIVWFERHSDIPPLLSQIHE